MTTLETIKKIKIDLTHGFIEQDQWSAGDYEFEVSPTDFLRFSKQDFKADDKRGNINALTNAKRAIDCQTDKIFFSIGLDPNNFLNTAIEDFISKSGNPSKKDLPIKLRFLQAINFAPAKIIANVRRMRHDLEHYYKKPSNEKVSSAIELAGLFIQATDSKLRTMVDFGLTDQQKKENSEGHFWNSIWANYISEKGVFEITGYVGKVRQRKFIIKNTSAEFYYLLRIATSFHYPEDVEDAVNDWIEFIGHPLPKQHFKIVIE